MTRECSASRVHHDQLFAVSRRLLEKCRSDRVIFRWIGADHNNDIGVCTRSKRCGDRTGSDAFKQGCNRRGVAKPGAVVNIIRSKTRSNEFLNQVGFLI